MSNNNNTRIFTLAIRDGVGIITDSKINAETGKGTVSSFKGVSSTIAGLKAVIAVMKAIPTGVQFVKPVIFSLPQTLAYLRYDEVREYWLTNKKTKGGQELSEEMLALVKEFDELQKVHNSNVKILDQRFITFNLYRQYTKRTWELLDEIKPSEKVNANEAF